MNIILLTREDDTERFSTKMDEFQNQNACVFAKVMDFSMKENQLVYISNVMTCIFNALFAVPAIVGNVLVIMAIWRTQLKRSPSNILLSTLAFADLQVGLIVQTTFVCHKMAEIFRAAELSCYARFVNIVFGYSTTAVSLLTLTAIAIERFLALHLHLRYKEVITKRRILTAACSFWVIGLATTSLYFIQRSVFGAIVISSELFSIVITSVAYIKIYKIVRRHAREIQSQRLVSVDPNAPQLELNMKKYQRSTFTMVIVFMLSFVCYVPYSGVMVAKLKYGFTADVKVAIDIFSTVVCINSSLNPLIYCWRMKEVRQAVWAVVKRDTAVTPGQIGQSAMSFAPLPRMRYGSGSKSMAHCTSLRK